MIRQRTSAWDSKRISGTRAGHSPLPPIVLWGLAVPLALVSGIGIGYAPVLTASACIMLCGAVFFFHRPAFPFAVLFCGQGVYFAILVVFGIVPQSLITGGFLITLLALTFLGMAYHRQLNFAVLSVDRLLLLLTLWLLVNIGLF